MYFMPSKPKLKETMEIWHLKPKVTNKLEYAWDISACSLKLWAILAVLDLGLTSHLRVQNQHFD